MVGGKFNITAETKGEVVDEMTGKSVIIIKVENQDFYIEEEKTGTLSAGLQQQRVARR